MESFSKQRELRVGKDIILSLKESEKKVFFFLNSTREENVGTPKPRERAWEIFKKK